MSERERFDKWYDDGPYGNCDAYIQERMFAAWQASAREQAEKDAAICMNEQVDAEATGETTDQAYNYACEHCAKAIHRHLRESFSREAGTQEKE